MSWFSKSHALGGMILDPFSCAPRTKNISARFFSLDLLIINKAFVSHGRIIASLLSALEAAPQPRRVPGLPIHPGPRPVRKKPPLPRKAADQTRWGDSPYRQATWRRHPAAVDEPGKCCMRLPPRQ